MRRALICIIALLCTSFFVRNTYAESSYVLPYPGAMPGNKTYLLHRMWEKIEKYWYFGNFGQLDYNLKEADKYLVEAKTLFEYKQYFLAVHSLEESNKYFLKIYPYLKKAREEGKNTQEKEKIFMQAVEKHIEIIEQLKQNTPSEFYWKEEKSHPSNILIHSLLNQAVQMRKE